MTWHLSTRIIGRELFVIYREKEVILCSEENCSELREREIRNNYVIWEDNCSVMREREVILCSEENCSELREREIRNNNYGKTIVRL